MRRGLAIALVVMLPALAQAGESPPPPGSNAAPARPPATPPKAPRTSDRCYTPAINCILLDRQKVGSSCWCVTPFGPSYGNVR